MKWIAELLYLFMKMLVVISYRIFYSKVSVINRANLHFKAPGILVSNHPSTLMDPLNVGVKCPRRISFLANAGLFNNALVAAFLNIYCIPIERPKDVDGRKINNADNFARADEHLANSGLIYIAAEGTSVVERRLRKLKTGTARIALSAESKKDFELGVQILPVGLIYDSPLEFRKELVIHVGEPINANVYKAAYQENTFQAAKKLTADIQSNLQSLIFHTQTKEQDLLLLHAQTLLQSDDRKDSVSHFHRSKKMLDKILTLDEQSFQNTYQQTSTYFDQLKKQDLLDESLVAAGRSNSVFSKILILILGFPFFLYGWINNLLALGIPGLLARRLKIYPGYKPAIMTLAGLILLPLFYYIQTKLVAHFVDIPYSGWIYLITLLPMGWLAWQYRKIALRFFQHQKARKLKKQAPDQFSTLTREREKTLEAISPIIANFSWIGFLIPLIYL